MQLLAVLQFRDHSTQPHHHKQSKVISMLLSLKKTRMRTTTSAAVRCTMIRMMRI